MREWREDGNWESFSPEFQASLKDLKTQYHRAEDADLGKLPRGYDERVLEQETDAEGWMKWVTVLKWVPPTEVIVNDGVWCCPLGGGESITIYENVDGEWQFKEDILSGVF